MKTFFRIIGVLLSYIFPYNLLQKINKASEYFYTGWRCRSLRFLGKNSKIGRGCFIAGGNMIVIKDNVYIASNAIITACSVNKVDEVKIEIGDNCALGRNNHLTAINKIVIGEGLLTGQNVLISDNSHGNNNEENNENIPPQKRELHSKGPIYIGKNVWIGENAVILGGVSIGDGAVIGANAVVTHNIPSGCVFAGNPAKKIK